MQKILINIIFFPFKTKQEKVSICNCFTNQPVSIQNMQLKVIQLQSDNINNINNNNRIFTHTKIDCEYKKNQIATSLNGKNMLKKAI